MKTTSLREISDTLKGYNSFLILSHIRPDADALGSELALGIALIGAGKKVTIWNSDGCPEKFNFFPQFELIQRPPEEPQSFEVVISLDCANYERLGEARLKVLNLKTDAPTQPVLINIDHHASNEGFGDFNYIDLTSPATGQILFELIQEAGFPLTREVAVCLYAAISTDTGSFQYPNTTAKTMRIIADLIELGVNVGKLNQQLYESFPMRRLLLLKEVFPTIEFFEEGRVGCLSIFREMYGRSGAQNVDNENFIDLVRSIDSVCIAVLFEEEPESRVRLSFRSKDSVKYNVNEIAALFGGGGHPAASGARPQGTLAEVKAKVLEVLSQKLTLSGS
ncbi:MAG: bifunctional oligoribonuclease/PAP phosphatase NrnA [Verrucomicrobiota bacterium]|nr:bifunctional oligoribonuclease/PAP phosphatase NrnA [Verrucomicrobiota bacterium]